MRPTQRYATSRSMTFECPGRRPRRCDPQPRRGAGPGAPGLDGDPACGVPPR